MSQSDFGTIDPNSKSGPQLALDLNKFRDALNSGHRGSTRPAYAQAGMQWVRETSSTQWDLMFFDGDTDFVLRSVNPTTNALIGMPTSQIQGLDAALALSITKDSALTTGAAVLPAGTAAQRPGAPSNGMLRYNTTTGAFEGYQGGAWKPITEIPVWGAITGTLADQTDLQNVLTALQNNQKITKEFVSSEFMISSAGLLSAAHGLGVRPKFCTVEMICKTAGAQGWALGDQIALNVSPIVTDTNLTRGVQVFFDAINVTARIASNQMAVPIKTTGVIAGITAADWRVVMRAYV